VVSITTNITGLVYGEPVSVVGIPIPNVFTLKYFGEVCSLNNVRTTFSILIPSSFYLVSCRGVAPKKSFRKGDVAYLVFIKKAGAGNSALLTIETLIKRNLPGCDLVESCQNTKQ